MLPLLTPLALVGVGLLLYWRWRATLILLALPIYYLATESFFLYEWRVAVPMHYALFAAAAAALLAAVAGVRSALGPPQNQAG
jgi:hypothetical protein